LNRSLQILANAAQLLVLLTLGCNSSSRSAELTVRNDIQDQEYNKIIIDQIYHSGGVALSKYTLRPGEEIPLPFNKITHLQVSRQYQDHSNLYQVTCPAQKKGVLIKLIDIHLNRMPGGCLLSKAGEERNGIVHWK